MTKKKTEGEPAEERTESGSRFFDPASCCGPMIERMMKVWESVAEREGPSATATGSGGRASCRDMMRQMMETCGRSRTAEDESKTGTDENHACC
jgi:hypothetical protein